VSRSGAGVCVGGGWRDSHSVASRLAILSSRKALVTLDTGSGVGWEGVLLLLEGLPLFWLVVVTVVVIEFMRWVGFLFIVFVAFL